MARLPKKPDSKAEREKRLAEALRANLRKRKAVRPRPERPKPPPKAE